MEYLQPVWQDNYIAISANSSNEYVPYLSVYLESIKTHASDDKNYDVVILEQSITDDNKKILKEFFETKPNLSLRFFNPSELFDDNKLIISQYYLCKESYFRLSAPLIFKNYKKLIFTDVDLIFNKDPYELFKIQMDKTPILSILEPIWSNWLNIDAAVTGVKIRKYSSEILNLENPHHYFNTGVMLMNLEVLNERQLAQAFLSKLSNGQQYLYQDQDIINEVIASEIGILPYEWNFEIFPSRILKEADEFFESYCDVEEKNIIHWVGSEKPWLNPEFRLAYKWWELARKTPFYEILIFKAHNYESKLAFKYRKNVIKYWFYKILTWVTFGSLREKYQTQKMIWKNKIRVGKHLRY